MPTITGVRSGVRAATGGTLDEGDPEAPGWGLGMLPRLAPYIIGGLVLGGVYAISAVGLVMTFISSKVLNFAHGAIAFFVAVAFYQFHSKWHWPMPVAAVVAIGILAPALGLFLWFVLARNLARVSSVVMLVTTVGLY